MENQIEKNETEESLYEALRSLLEQDSERSIFLLVERESDIKAAYRAAIYGKISLLFGNIFTEDDVERARESAGRAFCELWEENREFNGFIPKGILVDTPIALLTELPTEGFDFFCYDTERLWLLFSGGIKPSDGSMREAWERILRKHCSDTLCTYEIISEQRGEKA